MKSKTLFVCLIFAFIFCVNTTRAQTITIQRQLENDECTMGYLSVNDSVICYSLERADFSNSKSSSRIPLGTYKGYIRTDKKLGWRIELIDVPNRENIEIHVGNYLFQTTGCTLIGLKAKPENCTVLSSAAAIEKLKNSLLQIGSGLNLDSNSSEKYSITVVFR